MFRGLAADELDAAFCLLAGDPPEGLAIEPLGHEELVAAFAPDLAPPGREVGVTELGQHTIIAPRRGSAITSAVDKLFTDAGQPLGLALESGDPFLLRSLAARRLRGGHPPQIDDHPRRAASSTCDASVQR